VLQTRTLNQQGKEEKQVLVQWREGRTEAATWEDATTIQKQFPEFHLEDKVDFEEGSNVRESGS